MKLFAKIFLILFIIIFNKSVFSQNRARRDTTESFISKNFSVSGGINFYGELYSISGIAARRPSSTGRLLIHPTFTFFNTFLVTFTLFWLNSPSVIFSNSCFKSSCVSLRMSTREFRAGKIGSKTPDSRPYTSPQLKQINGATRKAEVSAR